MEDGRTIVVALDGSHHSDYAFDWYLNNSKRDGDNVVIVTCFDKHHGHHHGHGSGDVHETTTKLQADIDSHKSQADEFKEKLRLAGVKGDVVASAGKPGEVVVHVASERNASMIICGSRGHGALRRTIMGSISSYIVHHSIIPVVVCRNKSHHDPANEHHNKHH
ncbi:universal stress protein in QAH/OAS sulfhydrylase 3'region-like [Mytilus californianus]|uniref:universal stress protein in QAH/OAS sulfhydrylase 3'region-like n=1 Tax=Mytilus californianus TaxID=6549 RepID=UPI0022465DE7|nr:universal stress protein in QAH/OAS sulfhydrylase 3'region-like [Mytilus californianus]